MPVTRSRLLAIIAIALGVSGCAAPGGGTKAPPPTDAAAPAAGFQVPVDYHRLDNGLRVVIARDDTAPTVTVGVYYNIGFRIEPRDRTGFAHLFEHMMFQGSKNLGKMEFIKLIQGNGGVLNGSTRFDFTNYFEAVPANKLETVLWAEADRMSGLAITQDNLTNQQGVVTNEVKVNVLNRPYGGFPWLDMPQYANTNWYNAHNFYGELHDIEAATLKDVRAFFDTYYAPDNAVVVVAGDVDPAKTLAMVKKYFGAIPSRPQPAPVDLTEPRQTEERVASRTDRLATKPALAFSYHMPKRGSPEYYAMGVIDQILLQGEDSLLYQALVKEHGYSGSVDGGINLLGNMYNYNGPMLWTAYLIHDPAHSSKEIMHTVDGIIDRLRSQPLDADTVQRALVKLRSGLYDTVGSATRFGLVDLLASFALFDDDPARVNRLADEFDVVTPELIQKTAQEYLRPGNRTVLTLVPGGGA